MLLEGKKIRPKKGDIVNFEKVNDIILISLSRRATSMLFSNKDNKLILCDDSHTFFHNLATATIWLIAEIENLKYRLIKKMPGRITFELV